jgi:hypothetical protein
MNTNVDKFDEKFLFNEKIIQALDLFAAGNNLSFYYDIREKKKTSYLYDIDKADKNEMLKDDSLKISKLDITDLESLSLVQLTSRHPCGSEMTHAMVQAFKDNLPDMFFYYVGRIVPVKYLAHEFQNDSVNFTRLLISERHPESLAWDGVPVFLKAYTHATQWCHNEEEKVSLLFNAMKAHKKDFKSIQSQKALSDFIEGNYPSRYHAMFDTFLPDSISAKENPLVKKMDKDSLFLSIDRATLYNSNILKIPDMKRYEGLLGLFEKVCNLQHVKKHWGIYRMEIFEKSTKSADIQIAFFLEKNSPLNNNEALVAHMMENFLRVAQHNNENDIFAKCKGYLVNIMDKYHLKYKLENQLLNQDEEFQFQADNDSSKFSFKI